MIRLTTPATMQAWLTVLRFNSFKPKRRYRQSHVKHQRTVIRAA